jgi:flagellar hook-associated protein 1
VSINSASSIAFSSLMAIQVQSAVVAANLAGADVPGYTEEIANLAALAGGGGVTVTGITSNVDQMLMKSLVGSTSDVGSANTLNNYLDQLQQLYGTTGGGSNNAPGTSLGNTLASLQSAISSLASEPDDASVQANAVQALQAVASQLNQISSGIQQLRGNADQDIGSAVTSVNQQLQLIGSLNGQIAQATADGQPTASLEDQRNTALQSVAANMNISYYTAPNGSLQVYTGSGQALVNGTSVSTVSYTPASSVSQSTTYSPTPPSGFSGITVNGVDITNQISSGSISALVDLRDTVLPGAQSQLDQLATQLESSLNAVHNEGTSLPAPTTLTGAVTGLTDDTPFSATGTARIAVTDSSGNLVSYSDLDLSKDTTVGDLINDINTNVPGVSASLSASGSLVLTSTNSADGVAINEMSSSVGSSDQGFSDFFGLNDLVTGTGAANLSVRSDILSNPGLLATSTLDSSATLTTGASVLAAGSATVADNLQSVLTGSVTFGAVPGLGSTTTSFASYAADITASVASQSSQASTDFTNQSSTQSAFQATMSSETGVNVDQETDNLATLQSQNAAASQLIETINQMFTTLLTAIQGSPA